MTKIPLEVADSLDQNGWERMLLNGAGGIFLVEASARLIARHGYWIHVPQFMELVDFYPPDAAGYSPSREQVADQESRRQQCAENSGEPSRATLPGSPRGRRKQQR